MTILPLESWLPLREPPLVISGPCSAESREQVLSTATELAGIPQVRIFRAGIWKPRTRPESFEGVGIKGLDWLSEVRERTGLLTCVEVAQPEHIDMALLHRVDVLWIGARTVTNPFSMQDIASALQGVDIPVLVKNPVAPDLSAWIGALERMAACGIRKMIAVHRGFLSGQPTLYRNSPMWEIPIELKRLFPGLPVICDPIHICGQTTLLWDVAQKALDLDMDGLMIESHTDPEHALTDAAQQVTPGELKELLQRLILHRSPSGPDPDRTLERFRCEIDSLDAQLLGILAKRMEVVREMAGFKHHNNLPILQIKRWNELMKDRMELGEQLGLGQELIQKLLTLIHEESVNIQEDHAKKKKK